MTQTRPALTDYLVSRAVGEELTVTEHALRVAAWYLLDSLCVGLVGSRIERAFVLPAARTFVANGGRGDCLAVPLGERVAAPAAAGATAAGIHTIDFDDSYLEGVKAHFSTSLVPAVLAVATETGATGRDMLEAYARGFEVAARLGHVVSPSHLAHWHPTGTLGVIGVAAAASWLYRLDEDATRTALSLAADRSTGGRFFAFAGDATKPLHAAFAAHDGILCAQLARAGVVGPLAFFEGPNGFVETYSTVAATIPEQDGRLLLEDNSTKFHPAMHGLHAAIALALRAHRSDTSEAVTPGSLAGRVTSVAVHQCASRANMGRMWRPDTPLAAKLSLPYSVAVSLLDGECGLDQFRPERLDDPMLHELMDKIEIIASADLESTYGSRIASRVVITYTDGEMFDETFVDPVGTPRRPATDAQRWAKCERLLAGTIAADAAIALRDTVAGLVEAPSVAPLIDVLAEVGPVVEV